MARKPKKNEAGSLDSLLDTMTNVVGILVIVLIVTQLNVAEALKRIQSSLPQVTQEDVEKLEALVDQNRESRESLETTWADLEPKENVEKKRLEQLILEIDDATENSEELLEANANLEELKRLIAEFEAKVEVANEDVTKSDKELQRLKAMLDETPRREVLPKKNVPLPDPHPAPDDAEPRYVLCKYNRVYYIGDVYGHLFGVADYLDDNFAQFVYGGPAKGSYTYTLPSHTKKNDAGNPDTIRYGKRKKVYRRFRLDHNVVERHFSSKDIGGPDFNYRVRRNDPNQDFLTLFIEVKPDGGESIEEIEKPDSRFQGALKETGGNYLFYFVAADSFEAYLEARELSEEKGLPAGWDIMTTEEFSPKAKAPQKPHKMDFSDEPIEKLMEISRGVAAVLKQNYESAAQGRGDEIDKLLERLDAELKRGFPKLEEKKREELREILKPYLKSDKAIADLEDELRSVFGSNKRDSRRVLDWITKVVQWADDMFKYWQEVQELRKETDDTVREVLRDRRENEVTDKKDGHSFQVVHAAEGMRGSEMVLVAKGSPSVPFIKIFKPSAAGLPELPSEEEGTTQETGRGDEDRGKAKPDTLD